MKPLTESLKQVCSYLIIFSLVTVIVSCDDKEESINPIVGTWTIATHVNTECIDPGYNITITYFCTPEYCLKYIFAADGKFKSEQQIDGVTTIVEGTYSISGTSLTINSNSVTTTYTFAITENALSLTIRDPTYCTYTKNWTK